MSWIPSPSTARTILYGILIGFSLSITSTSLALLYRDRRKDKEEAQPGSRPIELRSDEVLDGVTGLIGNTPLVRINSLSDALGVEILGKAEYLNPGGSVKDRVALRMIEDAERQGYLHPYTGSRIFEGTVGSTGISLATIARARQIVHPSIIMPDDVSVEKVHALQALGADVERVRPASIVDKKQVKSSVVVTTAESHTNGEANGYAVTEEEELRTKPRGFFADQFENRSNFEAHFEGTGPEIWRQTNGDLVAFVAGAAGTGHFLKTMNDDVTVAIADPEGSGLYNKVKHGVLYDRKESEGTKRRHQVDTVVEGIGINRLTKNIELALPIIDDAFRITDEEAVSMSRFLVQRDGLFLGSSSACNLVACVKLVRKMGWRDGEKVVTIMCDSGNRHYSKSYFRNDEYLHKAGIRNDIGIVQDLLRQPFPPMSSITKI
ncbi:hypothetical protein HETIRDRAFT_320062 [Heterobasidion irregulare TC 32-1]|uniref:Tryptophan synthase beta chain-like PALP domain-containing protein n=1 Tax=Heterobasidion irregulare (strain TC 32-1) TaxID=747525 RepID=W4K7Q1_HETIT|nr:uncharacterized protein HETIRDRAFT_320062 [Heterobasidion irregulare TC 32-1]ETW81106.1 hypothetical protein HETIRDRAFT_320062 [Heterobasidion irregulare TC 32-1]